MTAPNVAGKADLYRVTAQTTAGKVRFLTIAEFSPEAAWDMARALGFVPVHHERIITVGQCFRFTSRSFTLDQIGG